MYIIYKTEMGAPLPPPLLEAPPPPPARPRSSAPAAREASRRRGIPARVAAAARVRHLRPSTACCLPALEAPRGPRARPLPGAERERPSSRPAPPVLPQTPGTPAGAARAPLDAADHSQVDRGPSQVPPHTGPVGGSVLWGSLVKTPRDKVVELKDTWIQHIERSDVGENVRKWVQVMTHKEVQSGREVVSGKNEAPRRREERENATEGKMAWRPPFIRTIKEVRTWRRGKGKKKKRYELATVGRMRDLETEAIPARSLPRCNPGGHMFVCPLCS
ncbi:actin nucleation-promoting factor WASL-like [Sorex araneus]|uniref:actin nucleation-promoting factor WASL-like n=1 Tax=Sorex araneus TaxID=42254 RepID=UPI0024335DC3|nr:actin nucleation-promoting factor WASL-like [Sorex araneus]